MFKKIKLKENIIALIGALVITAIIVTFININTSRLQVNISGTNIQKNNYDIKNTQEKGDLIVTYKEGSIQIIANNNFDSISSMSLEVMYDKEKINVSRDNIDSKYDISMSLKEGGNGYDIIVQNIGQLKKGDVILSIKANTSDAIKYLNVAQVQLFGLDGTTIMLFVTKK